MMNVRWKIFLSRMVFWLAAEISLSCLGLDDLADYSEFLHEEKYVLVRQS